MKTEKKRVGTKAEIRAIKNRERRMLTVIFLSFILIVIALSAYFGYLIFHSSSDEDILPEPTLQFKPTEPNSELKAAIVDHLSLTTPNETFLQTTAAILTEGNYTVDYFSGVKVTVNFYKNLPMGRYNLIILRVHSALGANDEPPLALFTSEPLDSGRHVNEQLTDQVQGVTFLPYEPGDRTYFGILPKFIESSVKGEFLNCAVIAMGCDGLRYTQMAQAFIEKGAEAYVGWNASVSASHTDTGTTQLLKHLIAQKQTIEQAVENTMKEVGPDPTFNSLLMYYPLEAGEQTIDNTP